MKNYTDMIKVKTPNPKMVFPTLTLGEELPITQLLKMTETICHFYSGYPNVKEEYKESCPNCPLSMWYCDKLSTLSDEYLREVMVEYGKILTLREKYSVHNYEEKLVWEKEKGGKK